MAVATSLCWASWGFVITNISPTEAGFLGFSLFFISLFFSLLGTNSIFLFLLYRVLWGKTLRIDGYVKRSLRDSGILSVTLVGLLFLQGQRLLSPWLLALFFLLMLFALAFIFSLEKKDRVR
jgi:hypothetical protein